MVLLKVLVSCNLEVVVLCFFLHFLRQSNSWGNIHVYKYCIYTYTYTRALLPHLQYSRDAVLFLRVLGSGREASLTIDGIFFVVDPGMSKAREKGRKGKMVSTPKSLPGLSTYPKQWTPLIVLESWTIPHLWVLA